MGRYLGLCDTFGAHKVLPLACGLPFAASVATLFTQTRDQAPEFLPFFMLSISGSIGFLAGGLSHDIANVVLRQKQSGITEGGKIVRRLQLAAYSVPVTAALIFNAMAYPNDNLEQSVDKPRDTIGNFDTDPSPSLPKPELAS